MKKSLMIPSVLGVLALAIGGCASPTATTPATSKPTSGFKACMVSDAGGFDDKSFNETSYNGYKKAVTEFGLQSNEVQSKSATDYPVNVKAMVDAKCDIIVTVGFALGDATAAAAKANPNVKFAIVDFAYDKPEANVRGLVFNTAEPSFLVGYLAASLTTSGKVGTFGGAKYPTVTIFMDGYARGVAYYNQQKGKSVQVLGWDVAKQDGTFIGGADPFGDVAGGKKVATNLVSQGADLILPVAGPAGEGALQVAQASGGKVGSFWVDTDGYISAPTYKAVIPSSVGKAMDLAVYQAIKDAKDGKFSSALYTGTLANSGVYMAPFHDWDAKVSSATKSELDTIKAGIIAGTIKTTA